jgi:hypothetical protein
MDYLQCNECKQKYELLPNEKTEDFNLNCGCGGTLKHSLDDDEQFIKENDKGYNLDEVVKKNRGHKHLIKPVGTVVIILGTIFWLFVFLPIGICCIILLMAWIGKKS